MKMDLDTSWRRQALPTEILITSWRTKTAGNMRLDMTSTWGVSRIPTEICRKRSTARPQQETIWHIWLTRPVQEWTSDMEKTITWAIWMRMEEAFIFPMTVQDIWPELVIRIIKVRNFSTMEIFWWAYRIMMGDRFHISTRMTAE